MISFVEHIEYLILNHDCVIIPGWGALIAQHTSARFDEENSVILPPMRSISFNQSINHNDGLLADSISRKEGIGYNDAKSFIEEEVRALKIQLNSGTEISIGRLGFFHTNEEGSLVFEPYRSKTVQSNLFGFAALEMPTLEQLRAREVEKVVPRIREQARKSKFNVPVLRYAASIMLLIAMSLVLTTPISFDKSKNDFASLNILRTNEIPKPKNTVKRELYLALPQEESETKVESSSSDVALIDPIVPIRNTPKVNKMATNKLKFYLVVASLPSKSLAQKHIINSKDKNMQILEKDGKYRIYVASGESYESVVKTKAQNNIDSIYPGAWICKR